MAMSWGRTLRDSLVGPAPGELALASIEAVNRRDWEALRRLLHNDFEYFDRDGNRVASPEGFIAALQGLLQIAPDFRLELDACRSVGSRVVMRGRTVSENPRIRSESVWRMVTRRGRIHCLESYHANERMRLHRYSSPLPGN
jgi:hypothetical protein